MPRITKEQVRETSARKFVRGFVRKNKLRCIGSGAFASAYSKSKSSRVVYKIGVIDEDGADFKYDAYLTYLERVVLKHQKNPVVPKVFDVRYITVVNPREPSYKELVYIVKMEKLTGFSKIKGNLRTKLLWRYGMRSVFDLEDDLEDVVAADQTGYIKRIANKLQDLFDEWGGDCHEGNIMWRKVGKTAELVITDPVA